ncbi:hypothetical protein GCM10009547_19240 [Sporichthya brevicatena]|uniref:Zinc finger DksA/TraR C4-type domain-containing protein n=1 Tax=Sporichthya brevicatena TaxID=171442 RepID=A0ABN1GRA2_9ACTN
MSAVSVQTESAGSGETLPDYRELLVTQWRTQLDDVTRLSIDVESSRDADGQAVGGARTEESRLAARLLAAARRQLEETEAALKRLDEGKYGICDGCRLPIPPARLEALPAARLCVSCQSAFRASAGERD